MEVNFMKGLARRAKENGKWRHYDPTPGKHDIGPLTDSEKTYAPGLGYLYWDRTKYPKAEQGGQMKKYFTLNTLVIFIYILFIEFIIQSGVLLTIIG